MDKLDCSTIKKLIAATLAGVDEPAETRKALKEHLHVCAECRRYEFTGRVALERRSVARHPKPFASKPDSATDAADQLLQKLRLGASLSIQALAQLLRACRLLDSPELRARAVMAISACPIKDDSFCQVTQAFLSRGEPARAPDESETLAAHLRDCPKCWGLWTYRELLQETASLRAEIAEEERRLFNSAGAQKDTAQAAAGPGETERMYKELRFLLVASALARKAVQTRDAKRTAGPTSEECADVELLTAKLGENEQVSPADYARVHEHLKTCPTCRAQRPRRGDADNGAVDTEEALPDPSADKLGRLLDSLLPFLLSHLRKAPTLSLSDLEWVCSAWELLPTPQERVQVAEALTALRIDTPPCCEGVRSFFNWEEQGVLSAEEETYLRGHLRECNVCWTLWRYRALLRGCEPLLQERGLCSRPVGPTSTAPRASIADCAHYQKTLVSMFEGRSVSEAESAALCLHLDHCSDCSGIEAVYRQLFAEEELEAAAQMQADRSRFAQAFLGLVASVRGKRPLAVRELGWLSLACMEEHDWRSALLERIEGHTIEEARYCQGIEALVLCQAGLSPLKQARLEEHLGECGRCWALVRCGTVLKTHASRQLGRSERSALPWYHRRWAVRARRVAALLLIAAVIGTGFKFFGKDPIDLLIQKVEAADPKEACSAARELGAYRESRAARALGNRILGGAPPELVGECVVALVRIGTKEAFDLLNQWENTGRREQRVVFPQFWTTYSRHDREVILETLLERGSVRLVKFFMADSLSHKEIRVAQFLRQVVERREEPELKLAALLRLPAFHMTCDLDLAALFDCPSASQPEFVAAIIAVARFAKEFSITENVISCLLGSQSDWGDSTLILLTDCQLYLFSATDADEHLQNLAAAFATAKGSVKTCLAAVLAESGFTNAADFLFQRLATAERTERYWIIRALNEASNRLFVPYIEQVLRSPPPDLTNGDNQDEMDCLRTILGKLSVKDEHEDR